MQLQDDAPGGCGLAGSLDRQPAPIFTLVDEKTDPIYGLDAADLLP